MCERERERERERGKRERERERMRMCECVYEFRRCSWCNGLRSRECTQRYELKFCISLFAFHVALITLGLGKKYGN